VQDSTATDGSGLGSLVYNTASLAARYRRAGASSWTTITLVTATLGTFTSGGFITSGGVTGSYEVGIPDAALAAGAMWVELEYYGAANMLPVKIEFELDAIDYQGAPDVNLTQIGGASQSATDLKDFADTGYDPVAHKVQGVVLTDTLTTYTSNTPQTGDSYARIGNAGAGLTALGDTRLANLDASISSVITAISNLNNLSALINIYGSPLLEIPDSSSTLFAFTVVARDNEGKLVNLDASPTITAANASGIDRSANLSIVSSPATGRYTFTYSVSSTDSEESLRITCSGAVSAEARYIEWIGAVVNYDTLTQINAIKAKTDNLPSDPASASVVAGLIATAQSDLDIITGSDGVTLATAQGNYAPAKAGNQMDLISAPNATAVTAIQSGLATSSALTTAQSDLTTLVGRLTAARAGYLDNLNVGGAVASQADILAINTSSSKHIILTTVGQYERPDSGSTIYTIEARTYSASDGSSVNADSTPTLTVTGQTTGSLAANLGVASNPATGVYRWLYTVLSTATIEPIRCDISATISTATFTLSVYSQVVDLVSATWTSTDATYLTAIYNKLPTNNIADETLVLAAVATAQSDLDTITGIDGVTLATAQGNYAPAKVGDAMALTAAYDAAKTAAQAGNQMDLINIPNATAITAIQSGLGTATNQTTIISANTAIKAKTDQLTFTTPNVVDSSATVSLTAGDINTIVNSILTSLNASGVSLTTTDKTFITNTVNAYVLKTSDINLIINGTVTALNTVGVTLSDSAKTAITAALSGISVGAERTVIGPCRQQVSTPLLPR